MRPAGVPLLTFPRFAALATGAAVGIVMPIRVAGQASTSVAPAVAIASAVLPLPESFRAGAAVVLTLPDQIPTVLRSGTNGFTCLADVPGDALFDVRCYRDSLLPLIFRRRALSREGLSGQALEARIDAEVRAGTLALPDGPTAGYRILGPITGFLAESNRIGPTLDRWQSVHLPYASASAIGVPEEPRGTEPYMMASGTSWAHLMIMETPLRY